MNEMSKREKQRVVKRKNERVNDVRFRHALIPFDVELNSLSEVKFLVFLL